MSTIYKFFIKDKVIIAPLKCGTRWLSDKSWKYEDVDLSYLTKCTSKSEYFLHRDGTSIRYFPSEYFLYREGVSHLESAILTDYIVNECDLSKTLHNLLNNTSLHWRSDLWEHIHFGWCYNKFQMVNYTQICDLIEDWDVNKEVYDFSKHPPFVTKKMVLDMIDTETLTTLYKGADNNNYWLEQILNGNDKIISKSVADALKIESDSKAESHITMLTNRIQTLSTQFVKELWDLKQINEKLQSKLDYTESMMGKPPNKLI